MYINIYNRRKRNDIYTAVVVNKDSSETGIAVIFMPKARRVSNCSECERCLSSSSPADTQTGIWSMCVTGICRQEGKQSAATGPAETCLCMCVGVCGPASGIVSN